MLEVVGAYLIPKGLGGAIMCFYGHIYPFTQMFAVKRNLLARKPSWVHRLATFFYAI